MVKFSFTGEGEFHCSTDVDEDPSELVALVAPPSMSYDGVMTKRNITFLSSSQSRNISLTCAIEQGELTDRYTYRWRRVKPRNIEFEGEQVFYQNVEAEETYRCIVDITHMLPNDENTYNGPEILIRGYTLASFASDGGPESQLITRGESAVFTCNYVNEDSNNINVVWKVGNGEYNCSDPREGFECTTSDPNSQNVFENMFRLTNTDPLDTVNHTVVCMLEQNIPQEFQNDSSFDPAWNTLTSDPATLTIMQPPESSKVVPTVTTSSSNPPTPTVVLPDPSTGDASGLSGAAIGAPVGSILILIPIIIIVVILFVIRRKRRRDDQDDIEAVKWSETNGSGNGGVCNTEPHVSQDKRFHASDTPLYIRQEGRNDASQDNLVRGSPISGATARSSWSEDNLSSNLPSPNVSSYQGDDDGEKLQFIQEVSQLSATQPGLIYEGANGNHHHLQHQDYSHDSSSRHGLSQVSSFGMSNMFGEAIDGYAMSQPELSQSLPYPPPHHHVHQDSVDPTSSLGVPPHHDYRTGSAPSVRSEHSTRASTRSGRSSHSGRSDQRLDIVEGSEHRRSSSPRRSRQHRKPSPNRSEHHGSDHHSHHGSSHHGSSHHSSDYHSSDPQSSESSGRSGSHYNHSDRSGHHYDHSDRSGHHYDLHSERGSHRHGESHKSRSPHGRKPDTLPLFSGSTTPSHHRSHFTIPRSAGGEAIPMKLSRSADIDYSSYRKYHEPSSSGRLPLSREDVSHTDTQKWVQSSEFREPERVEPPITHYQPQYQSPPLTFDAPEHDLPPVPPTKPQQQQQVPSSAAGAGGGVEDVEGGGGGAEIIDKILLEAVGCLMHQENCLITNCPCKQVKKRFQHILPQTRLHMQQEANKVVEEVQSGKFDPTDRRLQMRLSFSSQNFSRDIHPHYHMTSHSHIRQSENRQRHLQRRRSRSMDLTPVLEQPESCATTPGVIIPDSARELLCGPVFSPAVTPAGEKIKILAPSSPSFSSAAPPVLHREMSLSADNLPSLCLNDCPMTATPMMHMSNRMLGSGRHLSPLSTAQCRLPDDAGTDGRKSPVAAAVKTEARKDSTTSDGQSTDRMMSQDSSSSFQTTSTQSSSGQSGRSDHAPSYNDPGIRSRFYDPQTSNSTTASSLDSEQPLIQKRARYLVKTSRGDVPEEATFSESGYGTNGYSTETEPATRQRARSPPSKLHISPNISPHRSPVKTSQKNTTTASSSSSNQEQPQSQPQQVQTATREILTHLLPEHVANGNCGRHSRRGSTSSHLSATSATSHVSHASDGSITTETLC